MTYIIILNRLCCFKIKQESSGYLSSCYEDGRLYDHSVDQYFNDYYVREGIELDKENVKTNEGIHTVSKTILSLL